MSKQLTLPPCTKLSTFNAQLLTSTGTPALDDLLGGGLPIGSILMVREDKTGFYARLMAKYVLAQGLLAQGSGHHVAVLGGIGQGDDGLLNGLMARAATESQNSHQQSDTHDSVRDEESRQSQMAAQDGKMKIAWRYQNQKRVDSNVDASTIGGTRRSESSFQSVRSGIPTQLGSLVIGAPRSGGGSISTPSNGTSYVMGQKPKKQPGVAQPSEEYCAVFDLQAQVKKQDLETSRIHYLDAASDRNYAKLFKEIDVLVHTQFSTSNDIPLANRKVLRIVLDSLGAIDWNSPHDVRQLCQFLHSLRGLLRYSFATCFITLPAYLYSPVSLAKITHLVDACIALESYYTTDTGYFAKEYHGVLDVIKVPRLNHMMTPNHQYLKMSGNDGRLAFKCRRRKLCFETMHLPPELGEDVSRSQGSSAKKELSKKAQEEW